MGKITDSFKRQIGRDAGKVASNLLFGDSHSTPIRRVNSPKTQRQIDSETKEAERWREAKAQLEESYKDKIMQVQSIRFDDNPAESMAELSAQLCVSGWCSGNSNEETLKNKFSDMCLRKYKEGVLTLKAYNNPLVGMYVEEYKKLRRKRFLKKNMVILVIGGLFFVFFLIAILAELFE